MNPDKPQDMKRKSWNTLESDRVNYPTESDLDNSSTESQQDNFKIQSDLYNFKIQSDLDNFKIQSDLDNSPTESQQDNLPTDWRLNTLFPELEDLNHDESWMSLVDENNHGNSSQTAPNQEEPTPVVFPEEAPRELVEKQPRDTDNEISDASSSQKSPNQGEPAPTVHHEEEAQPKLISPRYPGDKPGEIFNGSSRHKSLDPDDSTPDYREEVAQPLEEDQNSESATAVVPAIPTPVCEASVHPNSQGMGVSQPIMNPASTSLPSFTDSPGPRFLIVAPQQQGQVSTVLELQSQATTVSGVVDVPILTNMEGEYGFTVSIQDRERTTKSPMWLMSKITKKLYTNINKAVPFEINLKKRVINEHFFIRAVPVFSSPQFLRTNVNRCPNHASPTDPTNHDFPYPEHVVRADHPGARYDNTNGRLSVRVPLDILQDGSGSDYTPVLLRFMCLGSCVGGINRRPIAIILTLENGGHVVGRKVVDVRVCACPTRDIRTDENAAQNKGKRKCSAMPLSPHLTKKKFRAVEPKIEPKEESDETFTITVKNRKLYDLLMGVIEAYHKSHPEYADKNPESR
ncbi:cellular tumor antigen p53 isoform X2 [Penaeus vannamei]|uniref:cellular tumor antigen p53 isoform X2 n=1 Tax=Penaeus vannamei TaxID=6689 RepID=UPI00387F61A4